MKKFAYSVFDTKSGVFSDPFYSVNDSIARRTLADLANDARTVVGRHTGDFMLMRVGSFEDSTGAFEAEAPSAVCNASELKEAVSMVPARNGRTSEVLS